jgi:hypothetical protein
VEPTKDKPAGKTALRGILILVELLLVGLLHRALPGWALGCLALLGLFLFVLLGGDIKPDVVSRRQVGQLLVFEDCLRLEAGATVSTYPLDTTMRIRFRYQGYWGESLGGRHHASGILNFIQLNDGPEYAFDIPHAARESTLREELRRWYLRRVQLKEYRQGNRTVLLTRSLNDEQVQQYQREFGIRLYS